MEAGRLEKIEPEALKTLRRGWCLGGREFKNQMLQKMEGNLREHHSGELRRETAHAKAERIVARRIAPAGLAGGRPGGPAQERSRQTDHCRSAAQGDDAPDPGDCRSCASGHVQECERSVAQLDGEGRSIGFNQDKSNSKYPIKRTMLWVDPYSGKSGMTNPFGVSANPRSADTV
jgi:hypothetical protein